MSSKILAAIFILAVALESKCDPGQPLFLTPYIQAGQIAEAKSLSLVGAISGINATGYAGYVTVNPTYNSNTFFWFFEAYNNPSTAPVLLWLQGGPGASGMFGLFAEVGPYRIDSTFTPVFNPYGWTNDFNVIFVDNPVGTGWSFTNSEAGYTTNQDQVAADLYSFLTQFFELFPEYVANEFYLTGESYAGKYIPAIGYKIHIENPTAAQPINLKGLAIGNGLTDPLTQNNYGDYLFGLGLIDQNQRNEYLKVQSQQVTYIKNGQFREAFYLFDEMLNGDFYPYGTMFYNYTGFNYYFNYLTSVGPSDSYFETWMQTDEVRSAIHVGGLTYNGGILVEYHHIDDFMNSTKPLLETLINSTYRVMLYSGQMDLIVPYVFNEAMMDSMNWNTKANYEAAPRLVWKVASSDLEVAGYPKTSDNFVEILVRNAGHMVPEDQPRVALDMITRFIRNLPWTNE
ncbi:hypothetical protein CHUAL_005617 [Chamberlinius hualienensis]